MVYTANPMHFFRYDARLMLQRNNAGMHLFLAAMFCPGGPEPRLQAQYQTSVQHRQQRDKQDDEVSY